MASCSPASGCSNIRTGKVNVLAPFFRLDPSRTRGTGGVGLGLAIAQKILAGHGGQVSVLPGERAGAVFELRRPV